MRAFRVCRSVGGFHREFSGHAHPVHCHFGFHHYWCCVCRDRGLCVGASVPGNAACAEHPAWLARGASQAESLSEVADVGFRCFHDLPGGADWNIDHVAVGTRGIFLIETKARRRHVTRIGQPDHVVIYDGETLQFPSDRVDTKAVGQASRNTKWLSGYLEKKTGEPVEVNPVLVLPGWYVETKGNYLVKAMNATYIVKYLRG